MNMNLRVAFEFEAENRDKFYITHVYRYIDICITCTAQTKRFFLYTPSEKRFNRS